MFAYLLFPYKLDCSVGFGEGGYENADPTAEFSEL